MRGSPQVASAQSSCRGSIPACAGEPTQRPKDLFRRRVYPRVCGGAADFGNVTERLGGLSPRVRGSQAGAYHGHRPPGSIPACAGEPHRHSRILLKTWVYPRVCGGANRSAAMYHLVNGLSPRVRGSQSQRRYVPSGKRSIPACAGEPSVGSNPKPDSGVYPRVCGGAPHEESNRQSSRGLSPRVRGSPHFWESGHGPRGSIPACAGEPLRSRTCAARQRSIPACAGEPF